MDSFKLKLMTLGVAGLIAGGVSVQAFAQKVVRIAYVTSELSPQHNQSKRFAELVDKKLPGHFKFQLYPNGQLGTEKSELEQIQLGDLDMANLVTPITEADRRMEIFDLPFLFKDRDHARRALTPELRKEMAESVEKRIGAVVLGIYENGFRDVISRRKIVEPSDMKGLKIRLSGGRLRQDLFKSFGANPTPIDWTEVYTALQTGVVDGAEAAIYGFYEAHLYRIMPHISLTNHAYGSSYLVVSKPFWQKLTPEEQKVFREAGVSLIDWSFNFSQANEQKQLEEMKKYTEVNSVDFEAFHKVALPIYKQYTSKYGDKWVKMINEAR
ncbi:MAG: TRAP transporter substrate-binding protein [Paralcaligenes sp.]